MSEDSENATAYSTCSTDAGFQPDAPGGNRTNPPTSARIVYT
jgi:hypothetical protein